MTIAGGVNNRALLLHDLQRAKSNRTNEIDTLLAAAVGRHSLVFCMPRYSAGRRRSLCRVSQALKPKVEEDVHLQATDGSIRKGEASGGLYMSVALITGSVGLIGSEAVTSFAQQGFHVVGVDNNMRREFFGDEATMISNLERIKLPIPTYEHHDVDIRDETAGFKRQGAPSRPRREASSSPRRFSAAFFHPFSGRRTLPGWRISRSV